jgi:hypothetical protein
VSKVNINIFNIRTKKKKLYIKSNCDYNFNKKKLDRIYLNDECFIQSLVNYIGQTITIYIVAGGEAGSGFTGVLLDVKKDYIKILTKIASPPNCFPGNECNDCESDETIIKDNNNITLGSITNIPINKIAAFVHNTI